MQEKTPKIIKIGRIIYNIFMFLLIIVLLITVNAKVDSTKKGEPIMIFGYSPTITVSGSMLPTIQVYSMSVIEHCEIEDVTTGDIITYKHPENNRIIIHRVICTYTNSKGEYCLQTQGDNNKHPDGVEITAFEFRGKVIKTMNCVAPILKGVMNEDGISINYTRLYGYTLLVVVLIWALFNALVWCVKRVILKIVYRKDIVKEDNSNLNDVDSVENFDKFEE